MPRFMLDTDTCSYIMKGTNAGLLERLERVSPSDICISAITKSELLYGIEVSPRPQQNQAALDFFLQYVEVLDFPEQASAHYARIRADLKKRGLMIGANDLLIATHARCLGLILVTNNTKEFCRVPDLSVENWTVRP